MRYGAAAWKLHAGSRNLGRVIYACCLLWAPLGEKTSSGIQVKREKELARVSPREVTDSWQHPLDPEAARAPERWRRLEVGWKEGETVFVLWDWAPFSILGQKKNSSWPEKNHKKPWISKNTECEEELCLLECEVALQPFKLHHFLHSCQQRPCSRDPCDAEEGSAWSGVKTEFLLFLYLHPRATETSQRRVIIMTPKLYGANIPDLAAGGSEEGMFENIRV